jgi:hypothetical protein
MATEDWPVKCRSAGWFPDQRQMGMFLLCSVSMVCLIPGKADRQVATKGAFCSKSESRGLALSALSLNAC